MRQRETSLKYPTIQSMSNPSIAKPSQAREALRKMQTKVEEILGEGVAVVALRLLSDDSYQYELEFSGALVATASDDGSWFVRMADVEKLNSSWLPEIKEVCGVLDTLIPAYHTNHFPQPIEVFQEAYGSSSSGGGGWECLKILVAGNAVPDLMGKTHEDFTPAENAYYEAVSEAARRISDTLMQYRQEQDPEAQAHAASQKEKLIGLFEEPIFVEEIPNGYGSSGYYKHLPWFVVTTSIGRIKIGWRKRVINIDWSETTQTKSGAMLFPDEDVTKGGQYDYQGDGEKGRYVHAWGYEKAAEYLKFIMGAPVMAFRWKIRDGRYGEETIYTSNIPGKPVDERHVYNSPKVQDWIKEKKVDLANLNISPLPKDE